MRDYRYKVELENAFDAFGISRFESSCVVYLQRLNPKSARNVLRDYLTISRQVHGQEKELDRWVHELDRRTHGWPAHIARWGEDAAEILRGNGGQLTAEARASVARAGREGDKEYYNARARGTRTRDLDALGRLLKNNERHVALPEAEVTACLANDRSKENSEQAFWHVLHKGMLAYTDDGDLEVPIPSMHDWLVARYQKQLKRIEAARQWEEVGPGI